jgi:hypothetical protein
MTGSSLLLKSFRSSVFSGVTALTLATASAQTAYTVPEGYVTLTAAAGTGSARTLSVLSLPLLDVASATGQMTGRLTGVTATTFSNSSAGWTAGQLSTAATPYLLRITSGTAIGRTFLLSTSTANTATTVTLDATDAALTDLTTLGIVTGGSGDTYQLIPCDTLSSVFGTPGTTGILGATSAAAADNIQLFVSGAWRQYYYNTTSNDWRRIGPNTASNNLALRPDSAVIYARLSATQLSLTLLGRVPATTRKSVVANSGVSFMAGGWPVDLTLATSGINSIPGWVSSTDVSAADTVQMLVSGAWRQYYHNGTNWRRIGPNTISDSVAITTGSGVIINKKGSATGTSLLTQSLPYSL